MTGPREVLYDIPSILIALGLLALMLVAMSLSWFLGRLALLLGFTFSLGLSRHDTRSTAVVDEANAIGTAWLRTDFLPADLRASAKDDLRRYTRLRLEAAEVSADQVQRLRRRFT